MIEIEAKVPVKKGDYKDLLALLHKEARFRGTKRAEDTYYEKLKQGTVRIRRRGDKTTFDLKKRETISGIESNTEIEWMLSDPKGWRKLLGDLGIKMNIKKTKKTEFFELDDFVIELNEIRGLGYYLEIERLVADPKEVAQTKKELIQLFKRFGYSEKQFEPKRYLELLGHV